MLNAGVRFSCKYVECLTHSSKHDGVLRCPHCEDVHGRWVRVREVKCFVHSHPSVDHNAALPSQRRRSIHTMTNDYRLAKYANTFRQYGDYDGSDLDVLENVLQEKVDALKSECESVEEEQEQLRETMGLASAEAEQAAEAGESKDVVRLTKRSPEAQKQQELREKLTG